MKIVNELNLDVFNDDTSCVSLGRLDQDMIDFITARKPELQSILSENKDVLFWKDRISHTERHKKDFFSENEYNLCFQQIPTILHNPDYISVHPKDNSISFIKDFSSHVSVAIRISTDGKLSYRTMYPLMDAQLTHYIDAGFAWKYIKNI
jgi:hypothetical protein